MIETVVTLRMTDTPFPIALERMLANYWSRARGLSIRACAGRGPTDLARDNGAPVALRDLGMDPADLEDARKRARPRHAIAVMLGHPSRFADLIPRGLICSR